MSAQTPTGPWEGNTIFTPVKVFIQVSPRTPKGPQFQMLHAQQNFYAIFHYEPADMPMPLTTIIAPSNDGRAVSDFQRAMVEGRNLAVHLNLKDKAGAEFSCFVSVSAGGAVAATDPSTSVEVFGRFTVVTIRSASVIGNCIAIGVMAQGAPFDNQALLEETIGVGPVSNHTQERDGLQVPEGQQQGSAITEHIHEPAQINCTEQNDV
mmetsp:Transcript_84226/g.164864  ORF Transcript_84226/g.164864 Transcript_84226/m.164864 type:complete len:208 (+) Transcript_84226:82-705(+)